MTPTMASEMAVRGRLSTSMLTKALVSVMDALTSCGRLWLMSWRRVSTSLV